MAETFILIPGRTSKQGVGISEGKFEAGYQSEINSLQMTRNDMDRLGIGAGDKVHCYGINSCKGHSDCKTTQNSCKGLNACKGHGFKGITAMKCLESGGVISDV